MWRDTTVRDNGEKTSIESMLVVAQLFTETRYGGVTGFVKLPKNDTALSGLRKKVHRNVRLFVTR